VAQLVGLLSDDAKRHTYDPMFQHSTEPVHLKGSELSGSVRTLNYAGAWPVADRAFLAASAWSRHLHEGSQGALIATRSVSPGTVLSGNGEAGVSQQVRARIHLAGFWIRPIGDAQSVVTMVSHIDFGGSMPASLINYVQTSVIPDILSKVRDLAPFEAVDLSLEKDAPK